MGDAVEKAVGRNERSSFDEEACVDGLIAADDEGCAFFEHERKRAVR